MRACSVPRRKGLCSPVDRVVYQYHVVEKEIEVEISLQYITEFNENLLSFANNVKTNEGCSHVVGFRGGLTKVINDYARKDNILKEKDKNLDSTDTIIQFFIFIVPCIIIFYGMTNRCNNMQ